MKKGLLLILGMLMMVSTVEATDGVRTNNKKDYNTRYGSKSIQFLEKGIKYYVFPNGKFDFNTNTRSRHTTQYVYRNGRRYKTRVPFSKVRISRDYYGRIKSIGNTYINYNRHGKISRIGSISIDYRHRKMTRVGGLRIKYDHYGNVRHYGQVKHRYNHYRTDRFIGSIFDFNDTFFYDTRFYNDYEDYGEDDDFYYYKSKGNKKGHQKGKVIKRKKLKKDGKYDDDHKERKRRS